LPFAFCLLIFDVSAVLNLSAKAHKNPVALLAFLVAAHMIVVSLNRAPQHIDGRRYAQVWLMTALTPVQWATAEIASGVSRGWSHYLTLRDARVEAEQLRAEKEDLQSRLLGAQEQLRLADQLRAFSEWQTTQSYPATIARVIARDPSQWFGTVVIDRGTTSGVNKDHPVVTPEGLVGRVVDAGPISARVLLLTDERHGAGAIIGQLAESRLLGVIKGRNDERCEMKFVATPEQLQGDEIVLTSGQDGIYPRGLVIGRIRRAAGEGAASAAPIEVEPAAALSKLDLVAVLAVPMDQVRAPVSQLVEAEKKKEKDRQEKTPGRRHR
jgi:rod shape-determining protein MreC